MRNKGREPAPLRSNVNIESRCFKTTQPQSFGGRQLDDAFRCSKSTATPPAINSRANVWAGLVGANVWDPIYGFPRRSLAVFPFSCDSCISWAYTRTSSEDRMVEASGIFLSWGIRRKMSMPKKITPCQCQKPCLNPSAVYPLGCLPAGRFFTVTVSDAGSYSRAKATILRLRA